jgi:hypothetical protein
MSRLQQPIAYRYRPAFDELESRSLPSVDASVMAHLALLRANLGTPRETSIVQTIPAQSLVNVFPGVTVEAASRASQSLLKVKASGTMIQRDDGSGLLFFHGRMQKLGRFDGYAELALPPGQSTGSGAAILRDRHGDILVGIITTTVNSRGVGRVTFSWRDSVELHDGTVVSNTGKFVRERPQGASSQFRFGTRIEQQPNGVVIAIIAILIG